MNTNITSDAIYATVINADDMTGPNLPVYCTINWDEMDAPAVTVTFLANTDNEVTWVLERDMFMNAVDDTDNESFLNLGEGDIRLDYFVADEINCAQLYMTFNSPEGTAIVRFDAIAISLINLFLLKTEQIVPVSDEAYIVDNAIDNESATWTF